jgi:hypothetical protein
MSLGSGRVAMVTMQSWLFLATFQNLRASVLTQHALTSLVHLGTGAFESIGGEVVSTAAFTIGTHQTVGRTAIARLVDVSPASAKSATFKEMLVDRGDHRWFLPDLRHFLKVPRTPLAYWFSSALIQLFEAGRTVGLIGQTAKGMVTADNAAFVRQWWEVSKDRIEFEAVSRENAEELSARWFPYARGGSYRKWFGNIDAIVDWSNDGYAIQNTMTADGSRVRATNMNLTRIFNPGVSWSSITSGKPSFRIVERGHLYDAAGGILQSKSDLYLMALLNSRAAEEILYGLNPTINVPPDYVGSVPVPASGPVPELDADVMECIDIQRTEWATRETAWEFGGIGSIRGTRSRTVQEELEEHRAKLSNDQTRLAEIEDGLDFYFDREFGLTSEPKLGGRNAWSREKFDVVAAVQALISYAVGCMFGRYSLDKFGLILANSGESLQEYLLRVPSPSFTPDADNVIPIVDGDWFQDDIVGRFRQFLRVAFGEEHFEENLRFVVESLGVKDLRDYFVKSFYKDHVQRYKKRPIYWLFSSPKGSFTALIYLHRYTLSTVSTVLNEYLREYIKKLEVSRDQQEFIVASGAEAKVVAAAQKEADRLRKVLVELDDYERDLHNLASQQIALDLDDGVLVNYQKFGSALRDIGLKKAGADD